ncbi:MAG: hypothetical protein ACHQQ3_05185 [Gemmatimonadales bacterium]
MFVNCIFCHADLGRNEAIEHFPVGRRLAFDGSRGRLWVVCAVCARWNLSPLEERWEAIEECERFYRDTKLRVSTDNIGLCRARDGTDLVRIGAPKRPEMAAWRYGDQFVRRRRQHLVYAGAGLAALGGYAVAGPLIGFFAVPLWLGSTFQLRKLASAALASTRTATFFRDDAGVQRRIRVVHAHDARLIPLRDDPFPGLEITADIETNAARSFRIVKTESLLLRGDTARRVLTKLLPFANARGGEARQVQDAVRALEAHADPLWIVRHADNLFTEYENLERPLLSGIPAPQRLAIEMAMHEEDERIALEGELAALEERWREAEEIAAISDNLFLPESVEAALLRFRKPV